MFFSYLASLFQINSLLSCTSVTLADDLSKGGDIDVEYSSYPEAENNNQLADSASDYATINLSSSTLKSY